MQVHRAKPFEAAAIAATLATAFENDPFMAHLIPPEASSRRARLRAYMSVPTKFAMAHGAVLTTDRADAAAAWIAPGTTSGILDTVRAGPRMLRAFAPHLSRAMATLRTLDSARPQEPHWYLESVGARPETRGQGAGRACLEPILAACDRDRFPAYLESSSLDNVPYYERYGFKVVKELPLPDNGPTMYLMWRTPN